MLLVSGAHELLTENVIILLKNKSIFTYLDFLNADNKFLEKYSSLTFPEIIRIKRHLTKNYSSTPINGLTYYRNFLKNSSLVPSGFPTLDNVIEGGFFSGTIYELCSKADYPIMMFITELIFNFLLKNQKIYFIDTKRDFSAKTMRAKLKNLKNPVEILNKIIVKSVSDKYELIQALFEVKTELSAKILIIHSISTPFSINSQNILENNHFLNEIANILKYLAHELHMIIIITNLITTWTEGNMMDNIEELNVKESVNCGKYWLSIPNIRIKIENLNGLVKFSKIN